jgi:hypothetical protein
LKLKVTKVLNRIQTKHKSAWSMIGMVTE